MVPAHWRLEIANAFHAAVRCQRIDAVYLTIDGDTNTYAWSSTLRLAERFSLGLELAHRLSLPLATLDRQIRAAAPALNIRLLGRMP